MPDGLPATLLRMGLLRAGETVRTTPMSGGVSSDIVLVETAGRRFCVKRALPRLKVEAVWEVPVGRNRAEAEWLRTVAAFAPALVPAVLGESPDDGLFAMAYLPPETHPVWKSRLLGGVMDAGFAAALGRALGAIHGHTAGDPELAARFANDAMFEAIRIEPYLLTTARRHPAVADRLHELAERTRSRRLALVHGDVSPKNILCGPSGPVLLDAECAWFGDPAFDLAFCLNHLLLKAHWRTDRSAGYLACFAALADAYLPAVTWEDPAMFEACCAALLPGLMLARVDGKSPVEYLTTDQRGAVRSAAVAMLRSPSTRLAEIADMARRG